MGSDMCIRDRSNDVEETLLLKASVPGPRGATVLIRNAVKAAPVGGNS